MDYLQELNVKELIDNNINNIFYDLVKSYDLKYGDMDIEQVVHLDNIKNQLLTISKAYLINNEGLIKKRDLQWVKKIT